MNGSGICFEKNVQAPADEAGPARFFVFEKVCMLLWQFICRKHGFCLDFLYNMNELLMMLWKDWYIHLILRKYILLEPSI